MKETNILTYADLTFDRVNRLLQKGSQSLTLTAKETELLYSLMRNAGDTAYKRTAYTAGLGRRFQY